MPQPATDQLSTFVAVEVLDSQRSTGRNALNPQINNQVKTATQVNVKQQMSQMYEKESVTSSRAVGHLLKSPGRKTLSNYDMGSAAGSPSKKHNLLNEEPPKKKAQYQMYAASVKNSPQK